MTDLFLFYAITSGGFGEPWTYPFSIVQSFGFAVYVVGCLAYMELVQLVKESDDSLDKLFERTPVTP